MLRERILAVVRDQPDGFRSKNAIWRQVGGGKGTCSDAIDALEETGELARREGRWVLGALRAAVRSSGAAGQEEEASPLAPGGTTGTVEGLAEIYDHEIAQTRLCIEKLRRRSLLGESAPGLAELTRTLSELIRRRRELIPEGQTVTHLTDNEIDAVVLRTAQEVVAAAVGAPDAALVGFAIQGADPRLLTLEDVLAEVERRNAAQVEH